MKTAMLVGVFFAAVALVLAVLWAVNVARYSRLYAAVDAVIGNELFCVGDEGPCRLRSSDSLPVPQGIGDEFDYAVARYCADLVARVQLLFREKHKTAHLLMPPGMVNKKTLYYNDNVIGFVGEIENVQYVAFRGTSTEEEWRRDFQFGQQDLLVQFDESQTPFSLDIECHQGFMNVFSAVEADIASVLDTDKPLVCTGHSLGSAIATLCCLQYQDDTRVTGYVFGSPRVCAALPTSGMRGFYRIVNDTDPVTAVPLAVMWNLKNRNKPYMYQHGGTLMWFNKNWQSIEGNHLMPVYIEALEGRALRAS